MHLNNAEKAIGIAAAGYAVNHAIKGTPNGQEGNPAATVARTGGNIIIAWVLAKFVIIPFLAITLLICLIPALMMGTTQHKTLLECFDSSPCTPLSYTGGTTATKPSEGDDIDKYGYIGTDANGNNIDVYHAVGWVHYKTTTDLVPAILLAIFGGLVWLWCPARWCYRKVTRLDRHLSGRDPKTGQRKPQVLPAQTVYYAQPQQPTLTSGYVCGNYFNRS